MKFETHKYKIISAIATAAILLSMFFLPDISLVAELTETDDIDEVLMSTPLDQFYEDFKEFENLYFEDIEDQIQDGEISDSENVLGNNQDVYAGKTEAEIIDSLLLSDLNKHSFTNNDSTINSDSVAVAAKHAQNVANNNLEKQKQQLEQEIAERAERAERLQYYRDNYRTIRNLLKVYPYALMTRHIMDSLNTELANTTDKKEQKRIINETEKQLFAKYESVVRNMTVTQGRILLKLISRETNKTGYQIIKDFKGGFSAGFWYMVGKLFKTDLKTEYGNDPNDAIYDEIIKRYDRGDFP